MNEHGDISRTLLAWYDRCARTMPWRGIHDPYRTWVSETMLQQTRVETVLPFYERFLDRFPTLMDLAAADESDVLKMWEGLGYYSRARNLRKGALQVAEQYGGLLPRDPAILRKISGIGPYTAGAIASIAYDVPVPAVDGNVIRVLSRLFGIRENAALPEIRKKLERLASALVPEHRPGDHNQAVMDLGATVCVPGTPDCSRCPLSAYCDAFARGDAAELPVLPRSRPQKTEYWTVMVLRAGDCTLVRRRTESLLHGLWCFPMMEGAPEDALRKLAKQAHMPCRSAGSPCSARHVFTHLIWEMTILPLETDPDQPPPGDYIWLPWQQLSSLTFPAAMNAALRAADHLFSR